MLFVVVVVVVVVETVRFTTDETGDDITYVVVVGIHDVVDYTDDDFSFLNGMYHHASAFYEISCLNIRRNTI